MDNKEDESLESFTISALLSDEPDDIEKVIPKFSSPLKTNFENKSLWLRLGLTLSLLKNKSGSPYSALQAFHECMRIDLYDPLPAMLAAKVMLEDLGDPEDGLALIMDAIKRCEKMLPNTKPGIQDGSSSNDEPIREAEAPVPYKNIDAILSRCYLLASIMHAHIYEREPASIKQFKTIHLDESLKYLRMAKEQYDRDHLIYFHQALHDAKNKSYKAAIENLKKAIELNPQHVPSIKLLILSLSALKLLDEALSLCETSLREFEDDLSLLYMKCNLERCSVETKGYKSALATAQHILKCIRKKRKSISPNLDTPKTSTNLFANDIINSNGKQNPSMEELTIWLLVAKIFIKIGSISDAELCIDEGSIHASGALSYQILFLRGLVSKAKNNLIEAKSFFQSCLALCPRHAKALKHIGHVHHLLSNHSIAEKFLRDSLDLDSDCHKTWHYLSLVYIQTNQHDKAKDCEKRASILEESSPVMPLATIPRLTLR